MGAGFGIGQSVVVMPEVKAAGGSHSLEFDGPKCIDVESWSYVANPSGGSR